MSQLVVASRFRGIEQEEEGGGAGDSEEKHPASISPHDHPHISLPLLLHLFLTVFYDIRKLYENISPQELRQTADHFSFDGALLKALCCLYKAPRRARWPGGTSRLSHPNGTIVAGCSAATGVAKPMTLTPLKRIDSETHLVVRST